MRRRWLSMTLSLVGLASNNCGERLPGSPIFGHAVLRGVAEHEGTTISLSDGDLQTVTDRWGYFAIADIPRGEYFITAHNDNTFERTVSTWINHDGESPSSANLVLSPFGRITGTIMDEDGGPIQFATVRVLGTDVSTTSIEMGAFSLDPAPAGDVVIWASYGDFAPGTATLRVPVGEPVTVTIALGPDEGPGPYAQNRAPEVSAITLSSRPSLTFPQVVPLVDTVGGVVRRGGSYLLSVTASDPDGDPVTTYWSADRGTLESTTGESIGAGELGVVWRAGGGISTLTCTVLDPYGGVQTARKVVEATGDNLRSGGRYDDTVYYSERRSGTFDLYRYGFETGNESLVAGGGLQQHAVSVVGDWLVYGDSEFVFIGTLVYRIKVHNLIDGSSYEFGQAFGHDDYFVTRLDLYTPLTAPFLPYQCAGFDEDGDGFGDLCNYEDDTPLGYGYLDLATGEPVAPAAFSPTPYGPANLRAFARFDGRDVWVSSDGQLWLLEGDSEPVAIATIPGGAVYPYDLQMHGQRVACLPTYGEPLYWLDLTAGPALHEIGHHVTSFALQGDRLAYVEQGPTSAAVRLTDLATGATRTLTTEPYFARRIWFMDDAYIIWGDQGTEGQAFVELSTELLWLDRL